MTSDSHERDFETSRTTPELSVVIPAFNAATTIDQQLDALAKQRPSFQFEVLVCDNGSTDDTATRVRARQTSEPWLRLVDASARRGPAAARNIGADAARAPLLAFCDADDIVGDGWLDCIHAALTVDEFVAGQWDGERLNASNRASVGWLGANIFTMAYLPWLPAAATNSMGIRREIFQRVGGFHETLRTSEDTDLSWRVQLSGHRLVHHPEILLHVRKRDGVRATFQQAFAYGVGDELLRERYADVIAAFRRRETSPEETNPASPSVNVKKVHHAVLSARAVTMKIVRFRGDLRIPDRAYRFGHRLGVKHAEKRRGSIERVAVPDQLPIW